MNVNIRQVCKESSARPYQPDSAYEGLFHNLGFDWSDFHTDFDAFIDRFSALKGKVPFTHFITVLEQLTWRIADMEAEISFLRAVFGEVNHAG